MPSGTYGVVQLQVDPKAAADLAKVVINERDKDGFLKIGANSYPTGAGVPYSQKVRVWRCSSRMPPAPAEQRHRPPLPTSRCPRPRYVPCQSARSVGAICGLDLQALSCPWRWRLVSESPDVTS